MAASQTQEESDCSELDFSICSGSEYVPSHISDLSDEDTHSLQSKTLKITDVSSNSDSDNEELRNMTLKKTPRTYGKRKRNDHKGEKKAKRKSEVTVKTCTKREDNKRVWDKKRCLYCYPRGNEEEEKGGGSEMDEDGSSQYFADVDEETKKVTLAMRKRGKTKVAKAKEIPRAKVKRPWSEAEKTAVQRWLGKFVAERRIPRKEHCMKCLEAEKDLVNRSWKDVKNFVYNTIVTLNRRSACKKLF